MRLLPDLGVALIAASLLALGWIIVRTLWIGSVLRREQHQASPMQAQIAVTGG